MAVKTITIDPEAFSLLVSRKRAGQSFSDVIKEHLGGKTTAKDLLKVLGFVNIHEDTLDRFDEQIVRRQKEPTKAPCL
jgi:predicted CopG family antitoxin